MERRTGLEPSSTLAETPPSPVHPKRTRSNFFFLSTAIFFFALAWWLFPYWQQSRADSFASQANDFIEVGNLSEAEAQALAALHMRPHDPRYLRLIGRLYTIQRNPAGIPYFEALLRSPDVADSDRYQFMKFAIVLRRPEIARPIFDELLSRANVAAESYFLGGLLEESAGRLPSAIKLARKAIAKNPENLDHTFLLTKLLIETRKPEDIEEAKKILFDLGDKNLIARLGGLRQLIMTDLSRAEYRRLVGWLRDMPLPTLDDIFLGYEIIYRADPAHIEQLGREAASRFTSGRPDEQIALGTWLNRHRLYNQTLLSIKPDSKFRPRLSGVYLDALIGAQKWSDALQFLQNAEEAGAKQVAIQGYTRLATNATTAAAANAALLRLKAAPAATQSE